MRVYQDMPAAMSDELIEKIETSFLKPVVATQDVCHA
jgi:hypothetical protein